MIWPQASTFNSVLTFALNSSTILFVFISGFLFHHLHKDNLNLQSYWSKKLLYVLCPYALVSIPALIDKLFFEGDAIWMTPFYKSLSDLGKIVFLLATGKHSGPFYFIPMISLIFLLGPLLFYFQKQRLFQWLAPILVLLGMFTFSYGYYASLAESLLYFLPVYLFGMWASKNKDWVLSLSTGWLVLLVIAYATIFTLELTGILHPQHLEFFEPEPTFFTPIFNLSKLKVMLSALVLLVLFYRYGQSNYIFHWLGNYSFGIYFVHIYFINAAERTFDYLQVSRDQGILGYLTFLVFVVAASAFTVYVTKRLFPHASRMLVGS
jgi:probable poly-beta-1,6-N-acetyl-D-glucosamine export protein